MAGGLIDDAEAAISAEPVAVLEGLERDDWLELRHGGLGGSDASGVVGLSQYTTPLRLWLQKTGEFRPPDSVGEAAEWGQLLEEPVAAKTAAAYGLTMVKPRHLYRHADPALSFMYGNPDRLAWSPERGSWGVFEAKTCGDHVGDDWADGPATHALIQATHYMEVLQLDWARISCLVGGQRFVSFEIERDAELADMIVAAEAAFWHKVTHRIEPDAMGWNSDTELLRMRWPEAVAGRGVLLNPDHVALVEERRTLYAEVKEQEARLTEMENLLRQALGDAEEGHDIDGTVLVTHKTIPANRLDIKALREAHPDIAEKFTPTDQTTRRLWFPKPKAA